MKIDHLETSAYRIPTERPESDGTLSWDATTIVIVKVEVAGIQEPFGLGYTYASDASVRFIDDVLSEVVIGSDPMQIGAQWKDMVATVRNMGRPGLGSMAIAAVDCALWDLKARLLEVPLAVLLGQTTESAYVYASGGFTSLSQEELLFQMGTWVHDRGFPRVKMKIGSNWGSEAQVDLSRVAAVREEIGDQTELFVDANGAYGRKQAVALARSLEELGVSWFEEPVSSDDLEGLRAVRDSVAMDVAAGEYGHDVSYFERMCSSRSVDVLQADVTRCAGFSEWLRIAAIASGHGLQISAHCAPSLHVHVACAVPNAKHIEYFSDHARIEQLLFDGAPIPCDGLLRPDLSRTGLGLELKEADARDWRVA